MMGQKRLHIEHRKLKRKPVDHVEAHPRPDDVFEWHYVITGPEESDYRGGIYWGKLIFPPEYPMKPPAVYMLTPSGRFQTDTRLCLSMSDFHPESWNPLWSVGSILTGLLSFMLEETPTTGSTRASRAERQRLARDSLQWNRRRPMFVHMFPDLARRADEERAEWEKEDEARKARQANAAKSPRGASAGGVIAAAGRAVGAPAAPFLETWGLHIFGVLAALVAVLTALLFR